MRAVVCDIDGTITDDQRRIQLQAIEALRKVQDSGIQVMLASGNVLPVAFGLSQFMGTKGPVIAENGGIVSWKEGIYRLHSNETALRAYSFLRENMPEVERLFTDNWRETEVALKRFVDLGRVREILKDWPLEIEATGFAIHLMEPGHSKLDGVIKGCELLGIDVDDVVAFGDSDNDAKMLAGVGMGVAVGNASPKAKAAARFVTSASHADGVIEGLRHLGIL